MLRTKDLKEGKHYQFVYEGNVCVCRVNEVVIGAVNCNFVVGLWNTPEAIAYHDVNNVVKNVNLKEIKVKDYEIASSEQVRRYIVEVSKYNENQHKEEDPKSLDTESGEDINFDFPEREWSVKDEFKAMQCYNYEDEEIVQFSYNGRRGIAIGMVDPVFKNVSFYAAMNLYGNTNQIVKHGDVLEDGTIVKGWPKGCAINKADTTQKQMGEAFMMGMYRAEIDAYHAAQNDELKRRAEEEERLKAIERLAEEKERLRKEMEAEELPVYDDLQFLPFLRREKRLVDGFWPKIDAECDDSTAFLGLHYLSNIMRLLADKGLQKTYLMSGNYMKEMMLRFEKYQEEYEGIFAACGGEKKGGAIVYTTAGGYRDVIFYYVNPGKYVNNGNKNNQLLEMVLISDDKIVFSLQKITFDSFTPERNSITYADKNMTKGQYAKLIQRCQKVVFAHLCMEQDTERTIWKMTSGSPDSSIYKSSCVDGDDNIVVRDITWFTNIFVNKTIEVDSYKSHRWCGSGADKHLEEVTVRGYTKSGYTVQAKVNK